MLDRREKFKKMDAGEQTERMQEMLDDTAQRRKPKSVADDVKEFGHMQQKTTELYVLKVLRTLEQGYECQQCHTLWRPPGVNAIQNDVAKMKEQFMKIAGKINGKTSF